MNLILKKKERPPVRFDVLTKGKLCIKDFYGVRVSAEEKKWNNFLPYLPRTWDGY